MKSLLKILFGAMLMVAVTGCVKSKNDLLKPVNPTFSFTFTPVAGGAAASITDKDCKQIQSQAVVSNGTTVITITGWDAAGKQLIQVNFVVQGDHAGLYAETPIVSFSGTCAKLSSEYPYETREDDDVRIELTKFDARGGKIEGTVNSTCEHTISYDPTMEEVLTLQGNFSIPRTY